MVPVESWCVRGGQWAGIGEMSIGGDWVYWVREVGRSLDPQSPPPASRLLPVFLLAASRAVDSIGKSSKRNACL